jgi:hypothetical protein
VLIPDMSAPLSELRWTYPTHDPEWVDSTRLFHLLRDWASEGLVIHTGMGYDVTPLGRQRAEEFTRRNPGTAKELRKAANAFAE